MPSDYEKIKADNIRDYGEKTHHLAFLGRLYSDRTHFIFELLQNAEDKNASRVLFRLFDDRLEVQHNGGIFDERDVRGICGVGEGTKAEDLTKIGKFGIGFKAVYAYTSVPEVHSGDEHFSIEHYVRPRATTPKSPGEAWTTLFVFGFDPQKVLSAAASAELGRRLRGLSARTLLFLRKITEIEYVLPDGTGGVYLRDARPEQGSRTVTLIGESPSDDESEKWLVFEKAIAIPGHDGSVRVEIALKLEAASKDKNDEIARLRQSPLFVFFPTEKETQLGFLIQGPYRTTPARDNIPKDDQWNATLVQETAVLVVEALHELKSRGLLAVPALNALPIRLHDFATDGMFYPIVVAVRSALKSDELLPAEDGTYVAAQSAKLGRGADLRKLLGSDQLAALFNTQKPAKWLSGEITQDRTPDLRAYLLTELKIEEIDSDAFARKISLPFMDSQSDEWFVAFYRYLSEQPALWRRPRGIGDSGGILRTRPILRLQDGKVDAPFLPDGRLNAYLAPPEGTDLRSVKVTISRQEHAAAFLKDLGLTEPDVFDDIIHRVLPKYARQPISVSREEHAADILKIFRALVADSHSGKKKVLEEARKFSFLRAFNCSVETAFRRASDVYRDEEDLILYFEGVTDAWFLDEEFPEGVKDTICDDLGILRLPRRIQFSGDLPPGTRRYSTRGETIANFKLHGFEIFLNNLLAEGNLGIRGKRSIALWRMLATHLKSNPNFFFGTYGWFYYSANSAYFESTMLTQLRQTEWISTADGSLKAPSGLSIEELAPDFREAGDLIALLKIATENSSDVGLRQQQQAAELGISLEDIEFLKEHSDDFRQWRQALAEKASKPAFPVSPSVAPERRAQKVTEQWGGAEEKEYTKKERSVRTTRSAVDPHQLLVDYYTNDDGQMVCQICACEMPFKKRNKEYYFEAVEIFKAETFSREHSGQYLALCPVCAAKYKEFVKSDEAALSDLEEALIETEELRVPILLGEIADTLKFVERHLLDLKTIMAKENALPQ